MREREPGDRLRVVIAGNIYAKRALVRRFLEDDGFDVVAEALTGPQLLGLDRLADADAVVVDADLLNGSVEPLRSLAPDAAIVVFTDRNAFGSRPRGADAYLEKGMGLASLTAQLHSLLSEPPPRPLGLTWTEPLPEPPPERRVLAGLAGVAAGIVLVAAVALAIFGGIGQRPAPNPLARPTPAGTSSPSPEVRSPLELAAADLDALREAIAAGRPLEARFLLDQLRADLLAARQEGFSISTFGTSVANLLQPLLGQVAPTLLDDLRRVLGAFLDFPSTGSSGHGPAGGSTTVSSTGGIETSGGTPTGGTGGQTDTGGGGGDNGGGGTGGGGELPGGGDTSGGNTGGGTDGAEPHGDNGNHYGWVNKPPDGGWHGTKPHPHDDEQNGAEGKADAATSEGSTTEGASDGTESEERSSEDDSSDD